MPLSFEQVLEDDLVTMARQFLTEFQFVLGEIPEIITIKLYKNMINGRIEFDQSHYIATPPQKKPFIPRKFWAEDEPAALLSALDSFTRLYRAAVEQGHTPSRDWLVRNPDF